jgi:arylsulfatase
MDDARHGDRIRRGAGGWRRLLGAGASRRAAIKAGGGGALGLAGVVAGQRGVGAGAGRSQATPTGTPKAGGRPNILAIMGDDIGFWNLSAYSLGMMGYRTPHIDRLAREGVLFTDAYGEQSCTAGRAAFITGQSPFRTGLLRIGLPGGDQGIDARDPTLAELLKPLGYATGQFGKNHLGDRNEFLPTVHGFDEFFGNLYHLNAEEEPEHPDYPTDPAFKERFGPRGVLRSRATDVDDPTEDPRFGRVGKQRIENTGPLDTKRMQTIDEEFLAASLGFIDRAHAAEQPFFVWFNSTRMHISTHLKPESAGATGLGVEADGMVEHDGHVGRLLRKLDDLGVAEDTIVIYVTDNGAEVFSWPDGGTTPFRGEKNSTWEGAYRIPMLARWPRRIPAGSIVNDIFSLQDWVPTLLAAAGLPDVKERLLQGYRAGDKRFRVHLDGHDQLGVLTAGEPSPRTEFFYFTDGGDLAGVRYDRWKVILLEQAATGLDVWIEPFDELRAPRIVDLRADPFERAMEESANYDTWLVEHIFLGYPVRDRVRRFYATFVAYPPRQPSGVIGRLRLLLEALENAPD